MKRGTANGPIDREVVVVGGGPAGASLAIHLARAGREVLLLERWRRPRAKSCGEYLSPDCLRRLDRLGLLAEIGAAGPRRLRGMRIRTPRGAVLDGDFPGVPARSEAGPENLAGWTGGISIPRPILDDILLRAAGRAGAEVRRGVRVVDLVRDGEAVTGVRLAGDGPPPIVRSRLVIGADGRHSVVAGRLGLRRPHRRLQRTAFVLRCAGVERDGAYGEVLLGSDSYCILNPLGEGRWTVGLVLPAGRARRRSRPAQHLFRDELRPFPLARDLIGAAARTGPLRGTGPLAFGTTRRVVDGALLVGDAAGFFDPLTGEGIHIALHGAELAAEAVVPALRAGDLSAGSLQRYEQLRRRHLLPKRRFCGLLQALLRSPRLVDFLLGRLDRADRLRGVFMGVVGDRLPAGDLLDPSLLLGRPA